MQASATAFLRQFGAIHCKIFAALGVGRDRAATSALGADLSDSRIGPIVTLDLGPGRGFTSQSLAAVRIPVLVLGAGENIDTQTAQRAFIAATNKELVPSGRASTFGDDAICSGCWRLYFSFMQLCKPSAAELIEEEAPGESVVCRDAAGAKRQSIHRQVSDISLAFWPRHFPQNRWCGGNSRNRGFSCENRDSGVARYRIRQKWRSICYLLA